MTYLTSFQISIEIEDVNDNTPYFVGDYSEIIYIPENNTERMELLQFEAHDNDSSRKYSYVT